MRDKGISDCSIKVYYFQVQLVNKFFDDDFITNNLNFIHDFIKKDEFIYPSTIT